MLGMPDTRSSLVAAARSVRKDGALRGMSDLLATAASRGLVRPSDEQYLAFCQASNSQPTPLIHDDLVASWLRDNGRPDLSASAWSARKYAAYLDQMQLGQTPSTSTQRQSST